MNRARRTPSSRAKPHPVSAIGWDEQALRNLSQLVTLAERQHVDRLRETELLDNKTWLLLGAQGGLFLAGVDSALTSFVTISWLGSSIVAVVLLGAAFLIRARKDTPAIPGFRESYVPKTSAEFQDQLLSNYGECIEENTRRNAQKARLVNWGLAFVFLSVAAYTWDRVTKEDMDHVGRQGQQGRRGCEARTESTADDPTTTEARQEHDIRSLERGYEAGSETREEKVVTETGATDPTEGEQSQ